MTDARTQTDPGAARPTDDGAPAAAPDEGAAQGAQVSYSASPGLAEWLRRSRAVIAFTSYQSARLYLLGANPQGGLMVNERILGQAMGLATPRPGTLVMAAGARVIRFEDVLDAGQVAEQLFDALLMPRRTWLTGRIDAHDVGLMPDGRPVFVATAWNCLATTSERHAFAPLWLPPFVSRLVAEDRCHLNGMAMGPEGPAYVTACSRSDTVDGWRDRRADGGVVVDVATGEIAASGLSMPHSPRLHDGTLWMLNSGTGEVGRVMDGAFAPLAFCPGFVRGLAFHEGTVVVGLSKPRHRRFEGLALDDRLREADSEPWCGIQVLSEADGSVQHWFRIDGAVGEIYDVAVMTGKACAMSLAPESAEAGGVVTHEPWRPDAG
jgi:uncharacterized protein (TIGR03032 family)